MIVKVKLFAAARERVGAHEIQMELPEQATVGDMRSSLLTLHPQLKSILRQTMFAVDRRYVDDTHMLVEHLEVACIPPVSGG